MTGSMFLLSSEHARVLVDCGMHQGARHCERDNEALPLDPGEISCVFITHAHIDHTGRLPFLVAKGFRGPIYSTPATKDLAEQLLTDSVSIIQREADEEGRNPLFTQQDLRAALAQWKTVPYKRPVREAGFQAEFFDAGHILGSAFIRITTPQGFRIVFSGDLGNHPVPLLKEPDPLPETDALVLESTYGGRNHEDPAKRIETLAALVRDAAERTSTLLIPAFAVQRTQTLLYELNSLVESGRVPSIPVFLDSPLASRVTRIYAMHQPLFDRAAQHIMRNDSDVFNFPGLETTESVEESKRINRVPSPKVIIAGSGMSTGGRILHHEMRVLPNNEDTILFVGYQAEGTRGRRIFEGDPEVEIFGEQIPVRARREEIGGYSAHADQDGLVSWTAPRAGMLSRVWLVHGEPDQMQQLALRMERDLGIAADSPAQGQTEAF